MDHDKVYEVKAVVMDGLLYVVGGTDGTCGGYHASGEVYNPDTKMWTDLPDVRIGKACPTLTVLDGRLWVFGGYVGFDLTRALEVLDIITNTWEEGLMPKQRCDM